MTDVKLDSPSSPFPEVTPRPFSSRRAIVERFRVEGNATRQRLQSTRAAARLRNMATKKRRGRPDNPNSKSGKIRALLDSDMTPAEIAEKVGATVALVYNIKSKASGTKKAPPASAKRGPGRPPKTTSASSTDTLGGILAAVQNAEKDRVRMRMALEKIAAVVADALT